MKKGQPPAPGNPYAQFRQANEILAQHEALQPKVKAYFKQHGVDYTTPRLDFVYEDTGQWKDLWASAKSNAEVIQVNLAQCREQAPGQPIFDYDALLVHSYIHNTYGGYLTLFGDTKEQWKEDRERLADKVVAEILGSPKPVLHNYMVAMVEAGRLSRLPETTTPETVRAAADEVEASYHGKFPRRHSAGHPHMFERMRDLAQLEFGWEAPERTVNSITYKGRTDEPGLQKT